MTNAEITIGHDVRRWTTYVLKDATEEELEALAEDGPELATKLREWDAAGRLEEDYYDDDETANPWDEGADPALIEAELQDAGAVEVAAG